MKLKDLNLIHQMELIQSKSLELANITENTKGFYGDLFIRVLNLFDIYGGYQRLDKNSKSGES